MENTARIIQLKAENVKKIKAVDITAPADNVIMITGGNAQGKTSVLDCITMAIGGKSCIPKNPIREGESSAKITLDVGAFVVERHWTDPDDLSKTYLKVEAGEGMKFKSPQSMLDQWVGTLSFDPLDFTRITVNAQAKLLASLIDFDFDEWSFQRSEMYAERTVINRELKAESTLLEAMSPPETDQKEEVSIADLANRLGEEEKIISENQSKRKWLADLKAEAVQIEEEIEALEKKRDELKQQQSTVISEIERKQKEVDQLTDPDIESTKHQLRNAETTNIAVRNAAAFEKKQHDVQCLHDKSNSLTEQLAAHDEAKEQLIKMAKLPIDGLTFTEEGVFFNNVSFGQLSSSEQLKVSMSIAMALNPKLRVIRITDGSLLDSESLKMISDLAAENDFQVWIEKVDETDSIGIVIEEGEVAVNNYEGGAQ